MRYSQRKFRDAKPSVADPVLEDRMELAIESVLEELPTVFPEAVEVTESKGKPSTKEVIPEWWSATKKLLLSKVF